MIPISDVVRFVAREASTRTPPVGVYWFECRRDRPHAATLLAEETSSVCIIPLMIAHGFENANALPSDLVRLLEQERALVQPAVEKAARGNQPIALVLLSRTRLREPLIGSPVLMPEWFPYCGGVVIAIDILDVASSATCSLKTEHEGIAMLQVLLYELQGIMLDRLKEVRQRDHRASNGFFDVLLKEGGRADDFLLAATQKHSQSSAEGFRATTSPKSNELLGRIILRIGERSPNELPALGDALFSALGVAETNLLTVREPLFAVALRSTIKEVEENKHRRCKRNVLLALYCSSQLSTAAAHSSEYGEFEVVVLRSTLMELGNVLTSFKALFA